MNKRLIKVIRTYIIIIFIFISYYFINKYTGFGIPCPFHIITGWDCPGCGITRCLFAIFELHFKEAFNYNPLVFIYLPFIAGYFLYETYLYVYDKQDKFLKKIPNYVWIIVLLITIIYGILRNIYEL